MKKQVVPMVILKKGFEVPKGLSGWTGAAFGKYPQNFFNITETQLHKALNIQEEKGGRLGEIFH